MVYARGRATTRNVNTPQADRRRFCISDEDVLELAHAAILVERHYPAKAGAPMPMDVECAKDGRDGALYPVRG
jgi:pyruvate,water dikinase